MTQAHRLRRLSAGVLLLLLLSLGACASDEAENTPQCPVGGATPGGAAHNAVIAYENRTYNVYHALAAPSGQNGAATLRIAEIQRSADGWPVSGGP
jgi:hypothetical protein